MTNITIKNPITNSEQVLTEEQFNSYMAQTNGRILRYVIQNTNLQKHQQHDQSSHGNWASSGAGTPIKLNPNDWVDYGFPDDFYNKLTDDEIVAVSDYQQTGFMRINRWLRDSNPNPNKITPTMKAIDSAIEKAPLVLPDNSAVFRAVDINFIEGLEEGSIITDKGYTSTTMRDLSKMKYSEYKKYEDIGRTIVRIDLGKNKKGLAVNTIHKKTGRIDFEILSEKEFLLPRDTQFEYQGFDEENKVYVLKRLT